MKIRDRPLLAPHRIDERAPDSAIAFHTEILQFGNEILMEVTTIITRWCRSGDPFESKMSLQSGSLARCVQSPNS
jgi:hypothetical protein